MISSINHDVRKAIGISSVHYLVAQTIERHTSAGVYLEESQIADILGITQRAVTVSINEMRLSEPAILQTNEFEKLICSQFWYKSQIEVPNFAVECHRSALAKNVVHQFNEINGSKYMVENNYKLVESILKTYPKLTLEHFESVIKHKKDTWGTVGDPMGDYNRPMTLFRNAPKFMGYYEESQIYWQKNKPK